MLALDHQGTIVTAQAVLDYIDKDPEWHPKIAKLGLAEPAIQNAMVELDSLFPDSRPPFERSRVDLGNVSSRP